MLVRSMRVRMMVRGMLLLLLLLLLLLFRLLFAQRLAIPGLSSLAFAPRSALLSPCWRRCSCGWPAAFGGRCCCSGTWRQYARRR
jgi:hypothetical protein